jgi:hypothetical protein
MQQLSRFPIWVMRETTLSSNRSDARFSFWLQLGWQGFFPRSALLLLSGAIYNPYLPARSALDEKGLDRLRIA